jgi:hypothetical protein
VRAGGGIRDEPVNPAAANPSTAKDYAIIARDIIPSGQYGDVPTPALLPKEEQQAEMYNALTPLFNHVTTADVFDDFKPEPVGSAVSGPLTQESVPHAGVTILLDKYDVPHIYGVTRDDVTWGAGWVMAEDRGLLLQEARYDAELAAVDAPGVSAIGLISSVTSFKPTAQLQAMCCTTSTSTCRASTPTWRPTITRSDRSRTCRTSPAPTSTRSTR